MAQLRLRARRDDAARAWRAAGRPGGAVRASGREGARQGAVQRLQGLRLRLLRAKVRSAALLPGPPASRACPATRHPPAPAPARRPAPRRRPPIAAQHARQLRKPAVTREWLQACADANMIVGCDAFRLPPFTGCQISVTQIEPGAAPAARAGGVGPFGFRPQAWPTQPNPPPPQRSASAWLCSSPRTGRASATRCLVSIPAHAAPHSQPTPPSPHPVRSIRPVRLLRPLSAGPLLPGAQAHLLHAPGRLLLRRVLPQDGHRAALERGLPDGYPHR